MSASSKISVVVGLTRAFGLSLIMLVAAACTVQHTRQMTRATLADLGLRHSVQVSRSNSWVLPARSVVFIAPTSLSNDIHSEYPRLRARLDGLLEAGARERFPQFQLPTSEMSVADSLLAARQRNCDILLSLALRRVDEKLSSMQEWSEQSGMSDLKNGQDHLELVMHVLDVRSGDLLDTLATTSRSGWFRWDEHAVADLAEPAIQSMLSQLRGDQLMSQN